MAGGCVGVAVLVGGEWCKKVLLGWAKGVLRGEEELRGGKISTQRVLKINGLSFSFEKKVNFSLLECEKVVSLQPQKSGKTCLLKSGLKR
ncbi:MAG: hypothetical protein IKJ78_03325 [Bacteroidales bacterium]|nr:hypothetical protein [Bacteroidales bacterium]